MPGSCGNASGLFDASGHQTGKCFPYDGITIDLFRENLSSSEISDGLSTMEIKD